MGFVNSLCFHGHKEIKPADPLEKRFQMLFHFLKKSFLVNLFAVKPKGLM